MNAGIMLGTPVTPGVRDADQRGGPVVMPWFWRRLDRFLALDGADGLAIDGDLE
jgi:hypothetical protein